MCGIAGIYHLNEKHVDIGSLTSMTRRMEFRGPDDEGYFLDGSFGMGMRRLSIIDLESGKQPIAGEDDRFHVILNGEIYNYLELRDELIQKGHTFKTKSDTEVLVHLFEEKGPEGVRDLNGIFAYAIWDRKKKELFIFRDRVGVKPLYYSLTNSSFYFGSNLSVVQSALKNPSPIHFETLALYLGLSYVPYPQTIFPNISKLPPASYLKLGNDGHIEISRYWQIDLTKKLTLRNEEEYCERIRNLLEDAVRLQMRSDVPVGTFLSGGFDSSSVVAMMSRVEKNRIKTFSLAFQDGFNELPYAREVAKKFGTEYTGVYLFSKDVPAVLNELIPYLDEPLSDNSLIPTFLLSREAAKNGVKVILNGTGGDEIFGGYERYRLSLIQKMVMGSPKWLRTLSAGFIRQSENKYQKVLHPNFCFLASGVDFSFLKQVVKNGTFYEQSIAKLANYTGTFLQDPSDPDQLMHFDLAGYLEGDVLSLLDKMTMAQSIEGRVPFLDHRLVELAFQIPANLKIKDGKLKWIFKQAMKNHLPGSLYQMQKRGFSGPTSAWVNGVLRDLIRMELTEKPLALFEEYFDLKKIGRMFDGPIHNSYSESIFALYLFSLWYKRHILEQKKEMNDSGITRRTVIKSMVQA